MAVYVIEAGDGGPVKIGIAADVMKRLAALQTAHHEKLRLVTTFPGGRRVEREMHERYRAYHLRGEWFALPADALAAISGVDTPEPPNPVRDLIDAMGGPIGLGASLSVPPNTVSTWKKRSRIPASWWPEVADLAARGVIPNATVATIKALVVGTNHGATTGTRDAAL